MTLAVNGDTDVYLILGDPVSQVRAPQAFNQLFERMGINAILLPAHVPRRNLETFLHSAFEAHNVKGLWVTIPHKEAALDCLQHASPQARAAGAVNAVRRHADGSLEGALFDGEGFVQSLSHHGIPLGGREVLVIGAGGAAAAIGVSMVCAAQAPAGIAFYDPVAVKAQALASRLRALAPDKAFAVDSSDPAGFDLVVNASPLGMASGDAQPCDIRRMSSHAVFVDILMKNQPTPALKAARDRGLVALPGFEMMIHQAHLYLEFFGLTLQPDVLREQLECIREQIYPPAMAGDWHRVLQIT